MSAPRARTEVDPSRNAPARAVFLDRDGTLHRELPRPVSCPGDLELFPAAGAAVARLNEAGWKVVVVTNQSAIARGLIDHEQLEHVHLALAEQLSAHGARIDRFLSCPHHPTEGLPPYRRECACRKPQPGLFHQAARELGLDLEQSWIVGDAERDLVAGQRAGTSAVLVATGKGSAERQRMLAAGRGDLPFVPDLKAAVDLILGASAGGPRDVQGR